MIPNQNPIFTIVIPTLNEEKYLPALLKDLKDQSYKDFEIIIVDGKSTDYTVKEALKFNNKLSQVIISSNNRNVATQRNLGAKRAMSKWIIFMDADNRLPDFFLEGIKYRILQEKPDIFTTWCDVDSKDSSEKIIGKYLNVSGEFLKLIEYPAALGSMIGVKKSIFNKYGGFDPKKVPLEDGDYIRKVVNQGFKFEYFRDPRYCYSLRRFRRSGKINTLKKYAQLQLKKLVKLSVNHEEEYPMGGSIKVIENIGFGDLILTEKVKNKLKRIVSKPLVKKKITSFINSVKNSF